MKSKIIFVLIILLSASCANKHNNFTEYNDSELLFQYIDDSLKGKINKDKYVFATYRIKVVCSNCLGDVTLDELMDTITNRYKDTPFYIITDGDGLITSRFVDDMKKQYAKLQDIFSNKPKVLARYGLYGNLPAIFLIENGDLKEALRLLKKDIKFDKTSEEK